MNLQTNRNSQLDADLFLTDGGLETTLIFNDGFDLPLFASFVLLDDQAGTTAMRDYYRTYLDIAAAGGHGFILETPTWRANTDWGKKLGYDQDQLADINRRAVELLHELRDEYDETSDSIIVSGNIGPRGDGYVVGEMMSADEATAYHGTQIKVLAESGAEAISALTMTYPNEAIGIAVAARAAGLPAVIGFTTETDGCLPNGQTLRSAIEEVDAATDNGPTHYMVNCAHVDHFSESLEDGADWTTRIGGVRANASRLSHAELDECEELDDGDPVEFGQLYHSLKKRFPHMAVFGGCCGTDHRHIEETVRCMA